MVDISRRYDLSYAELVALGMPPRVAEQIEETKNNTGSAADTIQELEDEVVSINEAIQVINDQINQINQNIDTIQQSIESLRTDVDANTESIVQLTLGLADAVADIEALQTALNTLTSRVIANEGNIANLQDDLSNLTTTVGANTTNIGANTSNIGTNTSAIATLNARAYVDNINTVNSTVELYDSAGTLIGTISYT